MLATSLAVLGMLGNVLGMLGNVLGRLRYALQLLLRFKAYKVESGGISLRCGTPRTLQSMLRSAKDVAKHAEDVAKHAEDGQGRCKHA